MSIEEKFRASVNVIRNLPKNGPVQPSNHLMLKFYAYYKQATEGPNVSPKPPFWDIIKKAKWDAWAKLGNMERDVAMKNYVDEFKKIVESVSNAKPGSINKSDVDSFYASAPVKDLELILGAVINKPLTRSISPNRTFGKSHAISNGSVSKICNESDTKTNIFSKNCENMNDHISCKKVSTRNEDDDDDDEFFLDTIENSDQGFYKCKSSVDNQASKMNAQLPYYVNNYNAYVRDDSNNNNSKQFYSDDLGGNIHVTQIITCLQKDLEKVVHNVNLIEQQITHLQEKIITRKDNEFQFSASSITSFILLFSWPLLLQLLIFWFRKKK